jgi:hypothetical protein
MSIFSQFTSGGRLRSQDFTSSGTFTVPAGVTTVWVTMCGGGGSGAGQGSNNGAPGGGAGAYYIKRPVEVTPGASITVTIGAGGASVLSGVTGNAQVGNDGSATSFGSVSVSGGGGGGRVLNNSNSIAFVNSLPGVGGAIGGAGSGTVRPAESIGGRGGFSGSQLLGGGAGGLFGNGGDARYAANAIAGETNSGAGGGGVTESGSANFLSGAGGSGRCIVEWMA